MSTYMNNLDFLRNRAKSLYDSLVSEKATYDVQIEEADGNNFQMNYKGKMSFANSIYSKRSEFEEMFRSVDKNCEALVIYGVGNGEIISFVKEYFKKIEVLIIVEPILEAFRRFASIYNFQNVFSELGMITFLTNKDANTASAIIIDIFTRNKVTKIDVVGLSGYCTLMEAEFEELKETVLRGFRSKLMQLVTLHQSRYMWLRNTMKNLQFLNLTQDTVKKELKGKPAVIVAAGPSLNKQFHLLQDLKKRAIFIGAGSAIKILNSQAINPDFRMVIDGNPDESIYDESFYDNSKEVPLLYASQAYADILPRYKGQKLFMMLPTDVIGKYLFELMGEKYEVIRSGASVVHSALSFLCEAGCNPIIFVGQDMCFYKDALYAEGIDSISQKDFDEKGWIKQKDIYGEDVYTVRNYLQIKYDYEKILLEYPNRTFINATEGGLGIKGTIDMKLSDVMNQYLDEGISVNINDALNSIEKKEQIDKSILISSIKHIQDEIDAILELNAIRLEKVKKITLKLNSPKRLKEVKKLFSEVNTGFEERMKKIPLYEAVIVPNISVQSLSLKHMYKTSSVDELENLKYGEKYIYGIITETEIFCGVMKEWIEELLEDIE